MREIDKDDPEWKKWYKYIESRYDVIQKQMHYYQSENLSFTRQIAAEMGCEFTPDEIREYTDLIKYTMELITNERNKNI